MKKIFLLVPTLLLLCSVFACSGNSDRDTSKLYEKSTTRGAIIERSGTLMKAGTDPERMQTQMMDAENRLQTGGGLFGKKGIEIFSTDKKDGGTVTSIGMPINPFLWKGSLETVSFMPLASADPFGGIIITDWYTSANNPNERCKLNIFIKGAELKTDNLKVNSFCQSFSESGVWIDQKINNTNNSKLENAILNKAKKLKLAQS